MMRLRASLSLWRRLAFAFVAIGLAVRALAPTGVMLDQTPDGDVTVRICTGVGTVLMAFDPHTGALSPVSDADYGADSGEVRIASDCDMALAHAFAPPPAPAVFSRVEQASLRLGDRLVSAEPAAVRIGAPLPARGPPVRV